MCNTYCVAFHTEKNYDWNARSRGEKDEVAGYLCQYQIIECYNVMIQGTSKESIGNDWRI